MTDTSTAHLGEDTNSVRMIVNAYKQSRERLLLLDYDGTLRPIAPTPMQATPPATLLRLLKRLAGDPHNTVVIVSGRLKSTLDAWLGNLPVHLVAEHGAFAKSPNENWRALSQHDHEWKKDVRPLLQAAANKVPGSFTEEKDTGIAWHFRVADPQKAASEGPRLTAQLSGLAKKHNLLVAYDKNLEVRLSGIHKGQAAEPWLEKTWDFILAAGDEVTDEDLFKTMPPKAYTIKIGPGHTAAKYRLSSVESFVGLLESVTPQG